MASDRSCSPDAALSPGTSNMLDSEQHGPTAGQSSPEAHTSLCSRLAAKSADAAASLLSSGPSVEIIGTELYDMEL